ncbi:MAG: metallophosphoesterase [Granulosicoccus sp.]
MLTAIRSTLRILPVRIIAIVTLGLSILQTTDAFAEDIKVAFIGDQGVSEQAQLVLELIRDEGTDILLIQGDLGYGPDDADKWIENIDSILGRDFPVLMVVGNHENYEWQKYHQWQKDKLWRVDDIECQGEVSIKAYCTYKNIGVVQVSPGITEVEGISGDDGYPDYITQKLSSDKSTWRFCSWHKNMRDMQAGGKGDSTGWGVYQNCLAQGGLVVNGHEHSYSRTHLMSDFENKKVIHTGNDMEIGPNSSMVVVSGLGGREVRAQQHGGDWFASIYTASQNANPGALFCNLNGNKGDCYFKDVLGLVPDTFKLTSVFNTSSDSSEEQERLEREEQERLEREEQERLEREEQERLEREEQERLEREEQERLEREEQERLEREEQERLEREEQERLEREEQERLEREEEQSAEDESESEPQAQQQTENQDASDESEQQEAQDVVDAELASSDESESAGQSETLTLTLPGNSDQNLEAQTEPDATDGPSDRPVVDSNNDEQESNPFGPVPTSIADSINTPIVNAAAPPPLEETEDVATGGAAGWLVMLMLSAALSRWRSRSARSPALLSSPENP